MIMPALVRLFILITMLQACKRPDEQRYIIEADLKKAYPFLEGQMIYLGNSATRQFEDSVRVKNGKFRFILPADRFEQPVEVSLLHKSQEPNEPVYYRPLGYVNPFVARTIESIFYLERGVSKLEAYTPSTVTNDKPHKGGVWLQFIHFQPQTELAFKHVSFKRNLNQISAVSQYNTSLIKNHSNSQHLLSQLYYSRQALTEKELGHLLTLFDKSTQQTLAYKRLQVYAQATPISGNNVLAQMAMKGIDDKSARVELMPDKYNLIVFWASWCGPCRAEIPQIKTLYANQRQNLQITSISLDAKSEAWKKAVSQEEMPWAQFLVANDIATAQLDKAYGLRSIPVWLLFDPNRKLVERQVGMSVGDSSVDRRVTALLSKR
jgi:thiol-disulfide isomerase/thioredoxin